MTFAAVDWIMSLDPHWFSTIFGFMFVAGRGLSALAFDDRRARDAAARRAAATDVLQAAALPRSRQADARVRDAVGVPLVLAVPDHLGRQPAGRDSLVLRRGSAAAGVTSRSLLVVGHFVLPFCCSCRATSRSGPQLLARVAVVHHRACGWSISIWLVEPTFRPGTGFPIHWLDIALPVGLAGVWLFLFARQPAQPALLPVNDPYLQGAFAHEAH